MEDGPPAVLRPLSLGETLDAAVAITRRHMRVLLGIVLVVVVPIEALSVAITAATTDSYDVTASALDNDVGYDNEGAYVAGQAAVLVLGFASVVLATVACFRALADSYFGKQPSVSGSLGFAAGKLSAIVWLALLLLTLLVLAFLAFVVPGIWLGVAWSMAFPVLLVEGKGGMNALRRSFQLVQGCWWATFGRLFVANLIAGIISAAIVYGVLAAVVAAIESTSLGALVALGATNVIASALTTPFVAAVIVVTYFDLRVRKEGYGAGAQMPADDERFAGFAPPRPPATGFPA